MKSYRTYITILLITFISTVLVFETPITSMMSAASTQESPPETSKESRCYNCIHRNGIRKALSLLNNPGICTDPCFKHFYPVHPEQPPIQTLHSRKFLAAAAYSTALRL